MGASQQAPTLLDRCRGALAGVVVGDCVGAPFEGSAGVTARDIESVVGGDGWLRHTDDTAQALAVAGSLVTNGGRLDQDHLARALALTWSEEPHRGYGHGAAALLAEISGGARWIDVAPALFGGAGSWGNGAAMRTIPVAIVAGDPEHAARLARQQAAVSHAHPLAADGAALIAVAARSALSGRWCSSAALEVLAAACATRPMRDAIDRVAALPADGTPSDIAAELGNGVDALTSVPAALAVARRHPDDPMAALHSAITLGGDTDTIAAMATGIVGAAAGIGGLDPLLVARCEGHDHADRLARSLAALATPG